MSTRATITFIEKYSNGGECPLVKIYHHGDGYIDYLGHRLASWLKDKNICNGLQFNMDASYANGVGCLVAQFIRDIKDGAGTVYIVPIDSDNEWMDYNYKVVIKDTVGKANDLTTISITHWDYDKVVWEGSPKELLKVHDSDFYLDDEDE